MRHMWDPVLSVNRFGITLKVVDMLRHLELNLPAV